jgi:hypothetical protein
MTKILDWLAKYPLTIGAFKKHSKWVKLLHVLLFPACMVLWWVCTLLAIIGMGIVSLVDYIFKNEDN